MKAEPEWSQEAVDAVVAKAVAAREPIEVRPGVFVVSVPEGVGPGDLIVIEVKAGG